MDPDSHEDGVLLNISTGQIAQPEVNVDRSLEIGKEQLWDHLARGILLQALQACGDLWIPQKNMFLLDNTKSWIRRPSAPDSYVF